MTIRGWLFALALGLIAAVMISGSRGLSSVLERSDRGVVQGELDEHLARVEARLEVIAARSPVPAGLNADSANPLEPARLRARHGVIVARLDSLREEAESDWRGALPGLRSAVADLEHRTDLAEAATMDSTAGLDQLLTGWLTEVESELDEMRGQPDNVQVVAYNDAITAAGSRLSYLGQRAQALRDHYNSADISAKRSLARELAELRRTVRALTRSTSFNPADSVGR